MNINLLNLDRSYVFALKEEFHIVLIKYSDASLMNNFMKNKRKIQKLHSLETKKDKLCSLTNISYINLDLWTDISVLFITQFVYFALATYVNKNYGFVNHNSKQCLSIFVENRLCTISFNLYTQIRNYFHPEIIIRMTRQYCKDTCIIHLIRILLYYNYTKFKSQNEVLIKLWNFIHAQLKFWPLSELDKFAAKSFYNLSGFLNIQVANYLFISTTQKWNLYEMQVFKIRDISQFRHPITSYKKLLYSGKYMRYDNNILFTLEGNEDLLTIIDRRFQRFYERRISSYQYYSKTFQNKIPIKWLKTVVQKQQIIKEVELIHYSTSLPIYLKSVLIPIKISNDLLIHNLSIYQICNSDGYPLSKINWLCLDDIQISQYFEQIYMPLYLKYSGLYNKNILQYLYYIIKYSYIKTIAFKHKKSFRFVLKFNHKFKIFIPIYNVQNIEPLRIWHLDILEIDLF